MFVVSEPVVVYCPAGGGGLAPTVGGCLAVMDDSAVGCGLRFVEGSVFRCGLIVTEGSGAGRPSIVLGIVFGRGGPDIA